MWYTNVATDKSLKSFRAVFLKNSSVVNYKKKSRQFSNLKKIENDDSSIVFWFSLYDLGDGEGADVVDMDSQLMWRPHNVEVQLCNNIKLINSYIIR